MSAEPPLPRSVESDDDEIDLGALVAQLWQGWLTITLVTVAAVLTGAALVAITPPTYQSDSLLQLEEKKAQLALPSALSDLTSEDPRSVTEIEIIRSRLVLGRAVGELNLDWRAEPELLPVIGHAVRVYPVPIPDVASLERYAQGGEVIRLDLLQVPPRWIGKEIQISLTAPGQYVMELPDGSRHEARVGQHFRDTDREFAIRIGRLEGETGRAFVVRQTSEASAIQTLRNNLSVSERGRQSGILELTYSGDDAQETEQILNAITRSYLSQNVARSAAEAESSLEFVESQLPDAREELNAAEKALNDYRQKQQSVNLELEAEGLLTQVTRLENELESLQIKEEEISQRYTENHPVYRQLRNNQELVRQRLDELRAEVDKLPETQREIINLTRNLEVAQTVYTELLNRAQELRVMRASSIGNVRIIDTARVKPNPIAPRSSRILALSAILGLFVGAGLVLLRNVLRKSVGSAEELEHVGLPVFATINHAPDAVVPTRGGARQLSIHYTVHRDGLVAEGFRSLRTSLHFGLIDAKTRSVLLTSASPHAGKSFVSVNLAAAVADAGQKVCLVDADMRRGHLRRYLGLKKNTPGLAEYLANGVGLDTVIYDSGIPGLGVIPTGRIPPNPSELLMRAEFSDLIQKLSEHFDLVLCDAPPVLAVTDPIIIARSMGANILVVRHGATLRTDVDAARRTFEAARLRLSGAVLNDFDPRSVAAGQSYSYSYRYSYESEGP